MPTPHVHIAAPDEVKVPVVRGPEQQREHDHTELVMADLAIDAGINREARPLSIPFDNSDSFPNPTLLRGWQQPQLFGLNLALMMANEG